MKSSTGSLWMGGSIALVVAAVAAGLFVLGSPGEQRERRFDDRRTQDLQVIAIATDLYWTRHTRLPASLEELAVEPGVELVTADPVTEVPYDYRPLDPPGYEVCASFDRASTPQLSGGGPGIPPVLQPSCQVCHSPISIAPNVDIAPPPVRRTAPDLWAHEAGRQCFRLEAERVAHGPTESL